MRDFCSAVFAGIQKCKTGTTPFFVAIDGPSGSGKTTLARELAKKIETVFGQSVTCLHMDDFYLPRVRQTEELAGNIHLSEIARILASLKRGEAPSFAPFDCKTQSPKETQFLFPTPLVLIEGSYALHPALRAFYDFSAFITLSPELQRCRLLTRQTSEQATAFFQTWIPREEAYFSAFSPQKDCDLLLIQK